MPRPGLTLPFRQRILVVLIALGAVPTAIAIFGWAFTIRTNNPATAARAAVEGVGNSGRVLVETVDTTRLRPNERRALAAHAEALNRALVRTQAAEAYGQVLLRRAGRPPPGTRRPLRLRRRPARRAPVAATEPAHRRAGRLDRPDRPARTDS